MKKLIMSLAVALAAIASASAQGTVKVFNISSTFFVSTNGTGIAAGQFGGAASGKLNTVAGSYYFALLIDASTPSSGNPLTGGWSVAQTSGVNIVGSNYVSFAGGIIGNGGANGVSVDSWAAGTTYNVELVGWSSTLGTTWSQIASQLQSGWTSSGYYGVSGIGAVASGGVGTPASAAASLFATGGIPSGWNLNGVSPIPEPTTIALAGLGGLSLLAFRRKKA